MTPLEIKKVLELHRKWRLGEEGGERAYLTDADLTGADLADADLTGAYLTGAYLTGADLARADLTGADLAGADLAGAYLTGAYLTGAYLTDAYLAGADLAGADLAGADLAGADLAGADLADADGVDRSFQGSREEWVKSRAKTARERAQRFRERNPDVPVVPNLDRAILAAIEAGGELDMSSWHICKTTHCRAGWAIHLAGEDGKKLEITYGPQRAGAMIYRASTGRVPYFFASDEAAMEDIRACAAEPAGSP